MTHLSDIFDTDLFDQMVEEKYVRVQEHPEFPLRIANYTEKAQWERVWNPVTLACRGLIYTTDGEIVARPFRKFFNLGETSVDLGGKEVRVYEKADGSLGVMMWWRGDPYIATRGSFTSDQAQWATLHLRRNWKRYATDQVHDKSRTYLFEIIYPSNRIVVDYGGQERLVCLGAVDIATGRTVPDAHTHWADPVMEHIFDGDLLAAVGRDRPNREGYVLHVVDTDERVKAKHSEYVRLHRIVTQVTARSIWELLAAGKPLDEILDHVPDEFYQWVRDTADGLRAQVAALIAEWHGWYGITVVGLAEDGFDPAADGYRKAFAARVKTLPNPGAMFRLLDGKDVEPLAWQMVKPEAERPFAVDVDA